MPKNHHPFANTVFSSVKRGVSITGVALSACCDLLSNIATMVPFHASIQMKTQFLSYGHNGKLLVIISKHCINNFYKYHSTITIRHCNAVLIIMMFGAIVVVLQGPFAINLKFN